MLNINSLSKSYHHNNQEVDAIKNISLEIKRGEFVAVVGPSGCGKTTLLKCIAGLLEPSSGTVSFDDTKSKIEIGMVFQNFNSFPWLTIKENIEFGLNIKKIGVAKKDEAVKHWLLATGLRDYANLYPKDLSGGMKQRLAIASTLANKPDMVLMDEPFGSLDSQTRSLMQELLSNIWDKNKTTIFFVTHDIDEAIYLADRVFVMSAKPGEIKEEIKINLERPRNAEIKLDDEFLKIKKHIHYVLRGESIKAAQFRINELDNDAIKIGLHTWAGITPFYFADDNGYFQKNNLKVKLVGLEKDEDRIKAFKNGEIDLLHLTADALYYLRTIEKIDCEIAMFIDSSNGGDALIVNSEISDIKQLVGKKIGVEKGLFSHFFLAHLLIKNGVKMADVEIIFLNGSDIGTNFLNKNIDAAVLWEPWLSSVLRITKTKILISTEQEKDTIVSVLFAKKNFLNKNRNQIKDMQKIWDEVIFDIKLSPADFLTKLSPYIGLSMNDFESQINKLKFIDVTNREKYRHVVKNLEIEGGKIWKMLH